ncbi:hypothetical protein DFA_00588 [Cavenderia fasciculata]|uniref:Paramecium surface antigen repeat-containing protein n=1 Tax=Cavenderia fasciculata TaxID=261658 RepID=F4PSN3_CACFS|nr:uncharacterized protein DFA_00588 [Cavenderia fasciculata]EGG20725.1 hypothetical protein DFA_00588 [Cavenderia fasciculata]|eukprot:XP_004358575.1 hypothetical protein DFA_00588 [Cavenderia fasciculata]
MAIINHLNILVIGGCFLLLLQFATAQETCVNRFQRFCVTEGDSCKPVYGESTYYCVDGTYCNELNYKCEKSSDEGEVCSSTGTIIPCKEWLNCLDGICVETGYANVGEKCTEDYQCNDVKLRCASNGQCQNIDTECSSSKECSYFNYCGGSVCKPRVENGQPCASLLGLDAPCLPNSICNKDIGICIPNYSLQLDANCSTSIACDVSQGLECDGDSDSCGYANFTKTLTPSNINCTFEDCGEIEEMCLCTEDRYTGFCHPKDPLTESQIKKCGSSTKEFSDCVAKHECAYEHADTTPSSCHLTHCASSFCAMKLNCDWDFNSQTFGKGCSGAALLEYQATCQHLGYSTGGSPSLTIPSLLMLLLFIATTTTTTTTTILSF